MVNLNEEKVHDLKAPQNPSIKKYYELLVQSFFKFKMNEAYIYKKKNPHRRNDIFKWIFFNLLLIAGT